jgi:hypothetical protein
VFGPIFKGIGLAASPAGRKVIKRAIVVARSEEGKKVIAQARKVATSPEGRKLIQQTVKAATRAGKAAGKAENRTRIKQAARAIRQRSR